MLIMLEYTQLLLSGISCLCIFVHVNGETRQETAERQTSLWKQKGYENILLIYPQDFESILLTVGSLQ